MNSADVLSADIDTRQALVTNNFSKAIFSYITTPAGKLVVLSRFTDDVWIIPDSRFTASAKRSTKRLNFKLIPPKFVHILKVCILKYSISGLFGHPPRGNTIRNLFVGAYTFLRYISEHADCLETINPILFSNYALLSKSAKGRKGEFLSPHALNVRFSSVETLHSLSENTFDPMPHPWPESSAATLAGINGTDWYLKGKTPIIPDAVLARLFQSSVTRLERAEYLINLRNECSRIVSALSSRKNNARYTTPYLRSQAYDGDRRDITTELTQTLSACMIVILTTSGVRSHELLSIKEDYCYTTEDADGNTIYWMRGRSEKTYEGDTEWVVTEITHKAISVAAQITENLRAELRLKISALLIANPDCHDAAQLALHKDSIFLGKHNATHEITTVSGEHLSYLLTTYCKKIGLKWKLASHQFRRTFAVYVVRSTHGDLRYLKKHFKHWSLDMTALYAAHEQKDAELLHELMLAYSEAKESIVAHMLDESTPLSGGLAEGIKKFRTAKIKTYKNRAEMVRIVSDFVHIRATSVAWCTNDLGNCTGGTGLETTRCGGCVNSIIDDTKLPIWRDIYDQQRELLKLTDIGESGLERVRRDVARCAKVLTDLGVPVELDY
nr:hypothetical protein [uncultured Pseudomonas sp.]